MKFRFVIGIPGESQSSSWKLWTQGDETYMVSRRSGSINKFSFHSSGICRWALTQERTDGGDLAMLKWKRGTIAGTGSGQGTMLLSVIFPTSHLSIRADRFTKLVKWIDPAPQGQATRIEAFLTAESRSAVANAFMERGERDLLAFGVLRDGTHVGVARSYVDCGQVKFRSPGNPALPGIVFRDLIFPEHDTLGTGRPIRMLMIRHPQEEGGAPTAWEVGGYESSRLENAGCAAVPLGG